MAYKDEIGDHFAYFGDSEAAQIINFKYYTKEPDKTRYVKFKLFPSERMEKMFDLSKIQDSYGSITIDFKHTDVLFLDISPFRTRVWIIPSILKRETVASRWNVELREALNDSERLIAAKEAEKNRLFEEIKLISTQQTYKNSLIRRQMEALSENKNKKSEDDDTESDED